MDIELFLILIFIIFLEGSPFAVGINVLPNVDGVCGLQNPDLLPQGCDFSNTTQFCNYSHQPEGVWLRNDGKYPKTFLSYNKIESSPNGTYAVANFDQLGYDEEAALLSPQIESGLVCVEFIYFLKTYDSNLMVMADNSTLWTSPGYSISDRKWNTVVLAVNSSDPYQLQFKTTKISGLATVGFDSVKLWRAFKPTTIAPTTTTLSFQTAILQQISGTPLEMITNADNFCTTIHKTLLPESCTFDSGFCNFTYPQESHPWEVVSGRRMSSVYGTIEASPNGSYASKQFRFNDISDLSTDVPEGEICIEFIYYLATSNSNIRVVVSSQSQNEDVWDSTGGHSGIWKSAVIGIKSTANFQLSFTSTKTNYKNTIGIDDVRIWKVSLPTTTTERTKATSIPPVSHVPVTRTSALTSTAKVSASVTTPASTTKIPMSVTTATSTSSSTILSTIVSSKTSFSITTSSTTPSAVVTSTKTTLGTIPTKTTLPSTTSQTTNAPPTTTITTSTTSPTKIQTALPSTTSPPPTTNAPPTTTTTTTTSTTSPTKTTTSLPSTTSPTTTTTSPAATSVTTTTSPTKTTTSALPTSTISTVTPIVDLSTGSNISAILNAEDFCQNGNRRMLSERSCNFDSDLCNYTSKSVRHPWDTHTGTSITIFGSINAEPNRTYAAKTFGAGLYEDPLSASLSTSVPDGDVCVEFSYFVSHSDLLVVANIQSDNLPLWNTTDESISGWKRAVIAFRSSVPFQISFTTAKSTYNSLIGLDDVEIWSVLRPSTTSTTTSTTVTTTNSTSTTMHPTTASPMATTRSTSTPTSTTTTPTSTTTTPTSTTTTPTSTTATLTSTTTTPTSTTTTPTSTTRTPTSTTTTPTSTTTTPTSTTPTSTTTTSTSTTPTSTTTTPTSTTTTSTSTTPTSTTTTPTSTKTTPTSTTTTPTSTTTTPTSTTTKPLSTTTTPTSTTPTSTTPTSTTRTPTSTTTTPTSTTPTSTTPTSTTTTSTSTTPTSTTTTPTSTTTTPTSTTTTPTSTTTTPTSTKTTPTSTTTTPKSTTTTPTSTTPTPTSTTPTPTSTTATPASTTTTPSSTTTTPTSIKTTPTSRTTTTTTTPSITIKTLTITPTKITAPITTTTPTTSKTSTSITTSATTSTSTIAAITTKPTTTPTTPTATTTTSTTTTPAATTATPITTKPTTTPITTTGAVTSTNLKPTISTTVTPGSNSANSGDHASLSDNEIILIASTVSGCLFVLAITCVIVYAMYKKRRESEILKSYLKNRI